MPTDHEGDDRNSKSFRGSAPQRPKQNSRNMVVFVLRLATRARGRRGRETRAQRAEGENSGAGPRAAREGACSAQERQLSERADGCTDGVVTTENSGTSPHVIVPEERECEECVGLVGCRARSCGAVLWSCFIVIIFIT